MNPYEDRKFVIFGIFLIVGLVYIIRLFYIQVIDDSYMLSAENQSLLRVTQYAPRGIIHDRNGELLVHNEAAYDLMVIPREVKNIDTIAFCDLLGITKEDFINKIQKAKSYSWRKASVFEKLIPAEQYAKITEKLYQFSGFHSQKRSVRKYPFNAAAHVLGYLNEVNEKKLKADPAYKKGDYVGVMGVEKSYEKELKGESGEKIFMRDKYNIIQGSYRNGEKDKIAIAGTNLISTIDAQLQVYGEKLMQNKKGSVVAIEPATGEILALVSSPAFDPNLLVGRVRTKNYNELLKNDSLDPLFNRALMAEYPPGSIFKIVQLLIAMQENAITENTGFSCNKALVGCHNHPAPSNAKRAIQYSCNPYFYNVFKRLIQPEKYPSIFKDSEEGLRNWQKHVLSFGLGKSLGIDIYGEKSGNIPGVAYYDKIYGHHRWAFSTIYSLSIGQGEISVAPVQMTNLAAIIANRGYYYTPHLIKSIDENSGKAPEFIEKHNTTVESKYFDLIIEGMAAVVNELHGTARRAKIDSITVCGKTGTAENPHGEDHSIFIAFAPKENPLIAISVYVENAGFGGTWAAPIASLLMEKYLKGKISNPEKEKRILEKDFINESQE